MIRNVFLQTNWKNNGGEHRTLVRELTSHLPRFRNFCSISVLFFSGEEAGLWSSKLAFDNYPPIGAVSEFNSKIALLLDSF